MSNGHRVGDTCQTGRQSLFIFRLGVVGELKMDELGTLEIQFHFFQDKLGSAEGF